jgi:hypothetical protein
MTPLRWAAVVSGLVGAFLVSVAAGGFIARQLNSLATVPPVAVVTPAPATASPPNASITSLPASPTATPEIPSASSTPPTASPTEAATPAVTPAAPSPSGQQTSPPTSLPSATASGEPTTTPGQPSGSPPTALPTGVLDPATAEEFAADLSAAIRDGQNQYLIDRLHPATVDRYGLAQCRVYIRDTVSGSDVTWEVQASTGPTPWDYVTDDLTTTIPDAWAVTVRQPGAEPEIRDLHFAPFDGTWRWFTDCGEPL